jgi:hypothetical protein
MLSSPSTNMRASQIEEWALRVLSSLERSPVEDSRVELKSGWIDPPKAARRIAAHANAAFGEPILWLIGVGEDAKPTGLGAEELANWWPSVLSYLAPPHPSVSTLTVYWREHVVVALAIDTSRAPYLWKNPAHGQPGGGPVEFEVPWREMTAVRTARHEDLIRLLVPQISLPLVEVIAAGLFLTGEAGSRENLPPAPGMKIRWSLHATLYFVPRLGSPVVLAGHKHSIEVFEHSVGCIPFKPLRPGRDSYLVELGDIVINLPTKVEIHTYHETTQFSELDKEVQVTFGFSPAGDNRRLNVPCRLQRHGDWSFKLVEEDSSTA